MIKLLYNLANDKLKEYSMERNNTHKGFKIFIIIFVLFALLFVKEENQQKAIDIFKSFKNRDKELSITKSIDIGNNEKLFYLNGSIIKWHENTLTFLNQNGDLMLEKEFSFNEPDIFISSGNIYLIDKSTGDIYQMDNEGNTLARLQTELPIFNIKEENNQLFIHFKEENDEGIKILNLDGEEIYFNTFENILTYSKGVGTSYIITNLEIDDGEINSMVSILANGGSLLDFLTIQNEIVLYSNTISDKVILLTDRSLKILKGGNIIYTGDYPLIKDILIKESKIYLLYGDNLEIIDLNGELEKKITYGLDYNKIVDLESYIGLYGTRDILVIKGGDEILKFKAEEDIINVNGNSNTIAINYLNKIEIYDIINKE